MRMFNKLFVVSLLVLSLLASSVSYAKAEEVVWPKRLVLSIPVSGGMIHLIASALGKTIEKHTPVERVIVQPIGGPDAWIPRMQKGEVDLVMHTGPDTVEMVQGLGIYKGNAQPYLRTVIPGNRNMIGLTTIPGKGIEQIEDLKGKTVVAKQPNNALFDKIAIELMAAAGVKESDLKANLVSTNFRETAQDMIEGRVDAFIGPGSGPFLIELAQAKGDVIVIGPKDEQVETFLNSLPKGFYVQDLPANAPHFGNTLPVKNAIMYRNAIYAKADMHPEIAYAILKAIDENRSEWESASPIASDYGTLYEYAPPYHEGVIKYYKEKGLWEGAVVDNTNTQLQAIGADK